MNKYYEGGQFELEIYCQNMVSSLVEKYEKEEKQKQYEEEDEEPKLFKGRRR